MDDLRVSPFSIDVTPKLGSPGFAKNVAFQKIDDGVKGVMVAVKRRQEVNARIPREREECGSFNGADI